MAKLTSLVALLTPLVIAAHADAQPAIEPHDAGEQAPTEPAAPLPSEDDLLRAVGLRPITRDRAEAIVSVGTHDAKQGQVRGTERIHGVGVEVGGTFVDRDARQQNGAGARVAHESADSRAQAFGDFANQSDEDLAVQHQNTDVHRARYGANWTRGRFDAHAFGESSRLREERSASTSTWTVPTTTQGASASLRSGRLVLGGIDQELVVGANYTRTSGATTEAIAEDDTMHMGVTQRTRRADHRFLEAYMKDTLHVIETLDVSGGFVVQDWSNLSAIETIRYGTAEEMDVKFPSVTNIEMSPQIGATYRATDRVAIRMNGYHHMRTPSLVELYQPIQLEGQLTTANPQLHPESLWGGDVGPEILAGKVEARAVGFWNEIDSPITSVATTDGSGMRERTNLGHARVVGVEAEASWRPAKPWLATVGYTFAKSAVRDAAFAGKELAQTPNQRASAMLTYDNPHIVTLTGAVRYLDRQYVDAANTASLGAYTLVDAVAARKISRGLAGFIAVENLLDRRYVGQYGLDTQGTPRTLHVGLRIDSARF